MQPSGFKTTTIQPWGSQSPARIATAGSTPMRVLVRNTGGTPIAITTAISSLSDINQMGDCYQLPAGKSDVFVLAPNQALYAASQGAGQASIHWSEAIPIKNFMES